MNKNLGTKLAVSVGILVVFLFGIIGIPKNWSGQGLLTAITDRVHLGLDLKGGTHLILQVQVDDAVRAETENAVERLKEGMRTGKINYADVSQLDPVNDPSKVVVKGVPPESSSDFRSLVSGRLPEYDAVSGAQDSWIVAIKPAALTELKNHAVTQAIETIRNRIDSLGVSEPVIQEHGLGQYQILVQLPGVDDPARVKDIIKSTAMLQIRQSFGGPYPSQQAAMSSGTLPPNAELLPGSNRANRNSEGGSWYVISRSSAVTGRDLRDAQPTKDENGQPAVGFNLTQDGGQKFYNFTSAHVNDSLAVVLDGKVESVARINSAIRDSGIIQGRFTDQEVADQCMILRSGALPASINYLEERTVGPSLGKDSIRAGVTAAIVGLIAVLAFMLVYYRGAGINADLALILNLIILLGFLGFTGATLTLPGIAGVILTVGMGVDSNVLIFERIREELRNGKTPPSAVEQGFSHAWVTIVDTHVTTVVSAAILFLFGTGPVKGFAITLTFGLLANLFTAVFVSRMIFDWVLGRHQRGEALSI